MEYDAMLVERSLAKDQHAFRQLVVRHQALIRGMLLRACRREIHLVDDLLQETFLRAYLSLAHFRSEARFSTWLYRIAVNLVADKFRRKSLNYCDLDSLADIADHLNEPQHSDLCGDLYKAMNCISEQQKMAVYLCLVEGYAHADAAVAMNVPLGTLKSHVARGRAQLQTLLIDWKVAA